MRTVAQRAALFAAVGLAVGHAPVALAYTDVASNDAGARVVLHQVLAQRTRSLFAAVADPGQPFGPSIAISPAYYFSEQQAVVDRAGGIVAAWKRMDPQGSDTGQVVAAIRAPGGGFGPPVQLSNDNRAEAVTLAGSPRGDVLVAWARYQRPVEYSFRAAGGRFGPATEIAGSTFSYTPVDVALDDQGGALVLYEEFDAAANSRTVRAAYRPPDGSFGPPTTVAGPPPDVGLAAFASNAHGDVLLAWVDHGSLTAVERSSGSAFGPPFRVADGLPKGVGVEGLAINADGAAVLAFGGYQTATSVLYRAAGGVFGPPVALGPPIVAGHVSVAIDPRGDGAVVWDAPDLAVAAAYRTASGAFSAPMLLASARPGAPGQSTHASLAIDGLGRAIAAWEQSDGRFVSLLARAFDATGGEPPDLVSRRRAYVREGPARNCRPGDGHMLHATRDATVFRVDFSDNTSPLYYGCLFARGTPVDLIADDLFTSSIRLAGPLVGYGANLCDPDTCETDIVVLDLRDETSGITRTAKAGPNATSEVAALRLRPSGAVAWISCSSFNPSQVIDASCARPSGRLKRVNVLSRMSRTPSIVDTGPRIDPRTFELRGSLLTWRDGSTTRSARLR